MCQVEVAPREEEGGRTMVTCFLLILLMQTAELTNTPCLNSVTLFLLGLFTFAGCSDPTCLSSSGDDDGGIMTQRTTNKLTKAGREELMINRRSTAGEIWPPG